jgi:hypothetical protein
MIPQALAAAQRRNLVRLSRHRERVDRRPPRNAPFRPVIDAVQCRAPFADNRLLPERRRQFGHILRKALFRRAELNAIYIALRGIAVTVHEPPQEFKALARGRPQIERRQPFVGAQRRRKPQRRAPCNEGLRSARVVPDRHALDALLKVFGVFEMPADFRLIMRAVPEPIAEGVWIDR